MFKGRTAAVLSLILCLAFFSTLMRGRIPTLAVSGSVMGRRPTVILDAGHGGFDGGAVAPDGTVEKEINLKIALKLKEFLRLGGYEVVMTRDSDVSTDDVETDKIAVANETVIQYINNRVASLENEKKELYAQIAAFNNDSKNNAEEISGYMEHWEELTVSDKITVVDALIESIRASNDSIEIKWKI